MKCGNCGTEFSEDEAVEVEGTNRYSNKIVVIAHECPMCGEPLSKKFTKQKNAEKCGHNATMDGTSERHGHHETCSECGKHLRGKGGFSDHHSIPSEDPISGSDAEKYWGEN